MNSKYHSWPCFTHEEVKLINKEIKKNIIQKEDSSNAASSVSKIGEFSIVSLLPLMELLHPWLYNCQYLNKEHFGYDVFWDFHLENMHYNVYGTNGEYGWHVDAHKKEKNDMKLTCLLNLSEEPYEGGEFYLINSNEKAKFDSGDGLLLNSLIAHKVTPVTKGKRLTLTYWAIGPSWR